MVSSGAAMVTASRHDGANPTRRNLARLASREVEPSAPINFFALNYVLLALSGIWPPRDIPPWARVVYMVLSSIAHFFFFSSSITYTVAFMHIESIDKATGALCDLFVIYLTNYKIFVLLSNKQLIISLVESLKYDMDVQYAPLRRTCRDHEERTHKLATKLTFMYYLVLLSVDATYIFMFLRAEWNDVMGIPQWDPLSLRRSNGATFFLYSCVPISAALMSGIHTTVFDTMILSFSMNLGAKIDNLARLVRTLEEEPLPGDVQVQGDGLAEVQRERLQRLHDAVRLHQRIIAFVDELESALSSMSLAQLLESLAAVCLQAYRLTSAPPSLEEGVPMINFLMWLLLQLWILCWSGENIATRSKNLATIAGRCHWMGAGKDFQNDMLMLMLRAQRPLCLTAFKMVKLNYPVYLDIVKNSYSLYTCMLRMKSGENKAQKNQ